MTKLKETCLIKRSFVETEGKPLVFIYGRFNLILDPRGHDFADLAAHKMWKMWLIQDVPIKGKTNYTANIVAYSPIAREEWELMNTEKTKFFFDFDEGSNWLQKMVDIEENSNGLMRKGPSKKAEYVAAGRAIESIKPEGERRPGAISS